MFKRIHPLGKMTPHLTILYDSFAFDAELSVNLFWLYIIIINCTLFKFFLYILHSIPTDWVATQKTMTEWYKGPHINTMLYIRNEATHTHTSSANLLSHIIFRLRSKLIKCAYMNVESSRLWWFWRPPQEY